jgi:hypothetical protein
MRIEVIVAIALVAACSRDRDVPAPRPTEAPAREVSECDRVLGAARQAYFADANVSEVGKGSCLFKAADKSWRGSLSIVCDAVTSADMSITGRFLETDYKARKLPGVGKGAWVVMFKSDGSPTDEQMVHAWDDDSDCMIQVRVPVAMDGAAIASAVLASLPAK